MGILSVGRKIKNCFLASTKSISTEFKPDGSTKFTFSISPQGNLRELEKILQDFTSKYQKTIGDLTPNETFYGLIAAVIYFFNCGSINVACKYAEEALKIEPQQNAIRIWLATIYGNSSERPAKERAIFHCNEILKIDPNNFLAKFCKAIYASHIEKSPDESIPLFLEAKKLMENAGITKSLDYGNLHQFLAVEYSKPSNYKDPKIAEDLFRKSIFLLKELADMGNNIAKFWLNNAEKEFKKLLL